MYRLLQRIKDPLSRAAYILSTFWQQRYMKTKNVTDGFLWRVEQADPYKRSFSDMIIHRSVYIMLIKSYTNYSYPALLQKILYYSKSRLLMYYTKTRYSGLFYITYSAYNNRCDVSYLRVEQVGNAELWKSKCVILETWGR